MRTIIFLTIFSFLLLWIGLAAFLTGYIPAEYLPENFRQLTLPKSTTDLGDSLTILDGVFTSIAMVLGLIAILLQGKELKESTRAQTEQAHSLSIQINQQNSSNILGAYAAWLQFLLTEVERLEEQIDKLLKEVKTEKIDEKKNEKWQIIKNSRDLQINYRDQTKETDNKIQELLNSI